MRITNFIDVPWTIHRIAGVYYHKESNTEGLGRLERMYDQCDKDTMTLELVRDPNNKYDKKAIKVIDRYNAKLIGWVPKEENAQLAKMMDELGIEFYARLGGKCTFRSDDLYMKLHMQVPASMDHLRPAPSDTLSEAIAKQEATDEHREATELASALKNKRLNSSPAHAVTQTGRAALASLGASLSDHDLDL